MSKQPERSDSEQVAVRTRAYELSARDSHPSGRAFEFWLEAEAMLEAEGRISARPRSLPFRFGFVVPDPSKRWWPQRVTCPVMEGDVLVGIDVTAALASGSLDALDLPPTYLAHDSRSVLLQVVAVTAALERIARLVEWAVDNAIPGAGPTGAPGAPAPFIVLASSPTNPSVPTLAPRYLQALLAPQAYPNLVAEIDGYLANSPYKRDVAFDIEVISFGSNLGILGRLRSNKLAGYLFGIWMFLGPTTSLAPGEFQIAAPILPIAGEAIPGAAAPLRTILAEAAVKAVTEAAVKEAIDTIYGWVFSGHEERDGKRQEVERWIRAELLRGNTKVLQTALLAAGYDPGPIDDIPGPRTSNAARMYCAQHHVPFVWPNGLQLIMSLSAEAALKTVP
jgi:Protein of unknown function (DUF2934)